MAEEFPYSFPEGGPEGIRKFAACFGNTTASYKFFWFLSLLREIQAGNQRPEISTLCMRMVSLAWYPIRFFRLRMGSWDSTSQLIAELAHQHELPADASESRIMKALSLNPASLLKVMNVLGRYVPYRFLSPWTGSSISEKHVPEYILQHCSDAPYLWESSAPEILVVRPEWAAYWRQNAVFLEGFCYWHLLRFLEKRNPCVPGLGAKIVRSENRRSLIRQRKIWQRFLVSKHQNCMYSGESLSTGFVLDHFLPFRFTAHDRVWNLCPVSPDWNTRKSDSLPDLKAAYTKHFIEIQFAFFQFLLAEQEISWLEEYADAGIGAGQAGDFIVFKDSLLRMLEPMVQIAANMGFQFWKDAP